MKKPWPILGLLIFSLATTLAQGSLTASAHPVVEPNAVAVHRQTLPKKEWFAQAVAHILDRDIDNTHGRTRR